MWQAHAGIMEGRRAHRKIGRETPGSQCRRLAAVHNGYVEGALSRRFHLPRKPLIYNSLRVSSQ